MKEMIEVNIPAGAPWWIVSHDTIANFHGSRYRLVGVIYTDRLESRASEKIEGDPNHYPRRVVETSCEQVVVRVPQYLVVEEPDTAVARLNLELADVQARRIEALRLRDEAREAEKKALKQVEVLAEVEREYEKFRAHSGKYADSQREKLRAMESDIGKLRAAIGDIRMKEILGAT